MATVDEVAGEWWSRWVHGRFPELAQQAGASQDLVGELEQIAQLDG
jgi:hypothetical protein